MTRYLRTFYRALFTAGVRPPPSFRNAITGQPDGWRRRVMISIPISEARQLSVVSAPRRVEDRKKKKKTGKEGCDGEELKDAGTVGRGGGVV